MVLDPFYFSVPQTERFLFCQKLHSWCGLVPRRKLRKKTCSCRDLPPEFSIGCLKYFLKICWLSIVVNCISQEHTPWKLIHTLVLAYDKRNTNQITGHCYLRCLSDVFPPIWVPFDIQGPKAMFNTDYWNKSCMLISPIFVDMASWCTCRDMHV